MRTKHLLTIALLLIGVSCPALARLGETNDEIFKRYGTVTRREAISTNVWNGFYQFNGYNVMVTFSNNVSVVESLSPILKRTMPADEVDQLKQLIVGEHKAKEYVVQTTTINGLHIVRIGSKAYIEAAAKNAADARQRVRRQELERRTGGF